MRRSIIISAKPTQAVKRLALPPAARQSGAMQIEVLNPNSSKSVTASIRTCLAPQIAATPHEVICTEIAAAPEGSETDADVALAAKLVGDRARAATSDALVVACFSDPGVANSRTLRPVVIGIAEAAYYAALQLGDRFGVISLGPASIRRHARHIDELGLTGRLAGDRAVDLSVAEANAPERAAGRIAEVGQTLLKDGADVLILGCAGMGHQRMSLQDRLGCPVIDPVQAGLAAAITVLDLNYRRPA